MSRSYKHEDFQHIMPFIWKLTQPVITFALYGYKIWPISQWIVSGIFPETFYRCADGISGDKKFSPVFWWNIANIFCHNFSHFLTQNILPGICVYTYACVITPELVKPVIC